MYNIDLSQLTTPVFSGLWNFLVGLEGRERKNSKGKIKFRFFFFQWEFHWSDHTNTKILTAESGEREKKNCQGPKACSNTFQSKNKYICPLNTDQNERPSLLGCPSWAMVCWMNTRSVCRICQINFNSERIWAVNTQEIALLVWAWSVIQEDGEPRRQEKEKACQGNWIICGIILCNIKFLFLLLPMLRWGQLECSIHVTEAYISVEHGWKALNACHAWYEHCR